MTNADDLGLTEKEGFSNKDMLRKETNEQTQRPMGETKSVKSDRGTFKDKC